MKGKQFEYPIYFDLEASSSLINPDNAEETAAERRTRLTECCTAFIDTLREAGYYGALYSNPNWLNNYLSAETLKEYGELWYARYQRDPSSTSEAFASFEILPDDDDFSWLDGYGGQVGLWQYTQCGVIENCGMDQKVDFNYAFKDYPAMIKKFCLNGFTPQADQ